MATIRARDFAGTLLATSASPARFGPVPTGKRWKVEALNLLRIDAGPLGSRAFVAVAVTGPGVAFASTDSVPAGAYVLLRDFAVLNAGESLWVSGGTLTDSWRCRASGFELTP